MGLMVLEMPAKSKSAICVYKNGGVRCGIRVARTAASAMRVSSAAAVVAGSRGAAAFEIEGAAVVGSAGAAVVESAGAATGAERGAGVGAGADCSRWPYFSMLS